MSALIVLRVETKTKLLAGRNDLMPHLDLVWPCFHACCGLKDRLCLSVYPSGNYWLWHEPSAHPQ